MRKKIIKALRDAVIKFGKQFLPEHEDLLGVGQYENGELVFYVLDLFNNGGCCYVAPAFDDTGRKIAEYDMTYIAVHAVYLVGLEDGGTEMRFYCFENTGLNFNDELAEPDHASADDFSSVELLMILERINQIFNKK